MGDPLDHLELVESADDFKSTDYKGYKPYVPAPRNYDWRDYHKWIESEWSEVRED